ncbi:MAG TPA: GyrI-like domain-containing protein [Balneolaceae bacterium]|nr:GyrI-like domain-containing protein [Balneolaceae bacterium]
MPEIKTFPKKQFVGTHKQMSFTNNKTHELWSNFMPRRKEIPNSVGIELYSIEIYPETYFDDFNPNREFEKWAAVEVTDFNTMPNRMESLTIPEGAYAVFIHKGPASEGPKTYNYIFKEWLPNSNFLLDHRPHFAVMGEKYKRNDPDSEEELWIPIKPE